MITEVIWHDIECGRYLQDLGLWLELARRAAGRGAVLDVGAGTGRVTLALARAGHAVVALDQSHTLLGELERRAFGLAVRTVCADARDFALEERFPLIVVPMQTLQLLGGSAGRNAFLACAAAHLQPGGLLALAVAASEDFEPFQWREGDLAPLPDVAELDGSAYFSQPTAVRRVRGGFVLERRREVVDAAGRHSQSTNTVTLEDVSIEELARAGAAVGLRVLERRTVAATEEHIASEVVILGG